MRYWLLIIAYGLIAICCEAQNVPLVYGVENTGFHLKKPKMTAPDKLPVIRELPDALQGVGNFADWVKRRSDIGHMIQHYGIGIKPTVEGSQVKARIRARRWWSRCLAQIA